MVIKPAGKKSTVEKRQPTSLRRNWSIAVGLVVLVVLCLAPSSEVEQSFDEGPAEVRTVVFGPEEPSAKVRRVAFGGFAREEQEPLSSPYIEPHDISSERFAEATIHSVTLDEEGNELAKLRVGRDSLRTPSENAELLWARDDNEYDPSHDAIPRIPEHRFKKGAERRCNGCHQNQLH